MNEREKGRQKRRQKKKTENYSYRQTDRYKSLIDMRYNNK